MDEQPSSIANLPCLKSSEDSLEVDSSCTTQPTAVSPSSNYQTDDDHLTPAPSAEGQECQHALEVNVECNINPDDDIPANLEGYSVPATIQTVALSAHKKEEQTMHHPAEEKITTNQPDVLTKPNEEQKESTTEESGTTHTNTDQQGKQDQVGLTEALTVAESEEQTEASELAANEPAMDTTGTDNKQPKLGTCGDTVTDDLVLEDTLLAGNLGSPDPEDSLSSLDSSPEKVDVRPLNSNELDCLEMTEEVENPLIHKPEDPEKPEMKLPDKDDSPDFQLILKDDSEKVNVRLLNSNEDLDCLETTEEVENPLIHKPEDSEKPEMKLPDKDDSPDFQLILKDDSEKVNVRPLNSNEDLDCLEMTEEVENPLIHKPEDSEQLEMKLPDKDDSPDFQLILKDDSEKVDVRPLNSNEDLDCLEKTEEVENPLIHKPEDSEKPEMKLPDKDDSPDFQLILKDVSEKVVVRPLNSNEDLDCLETTEEVENPLIHKPEDSEQSEMKLPDKDDSPDFQLILKDDSEKVDVRPLNFNEDLDCLETTEEVENPLIHKPEDSEKPEMKLPDKDDSPDFQLILKDDSEKVDVRPLNSNEDLDCLEMTEEVENPLIHKPEDSEQLEMKLPDKDDSPDFQLILKDDSEKVDVRPLNSNEDLDCLEKTEEVENPLIHKPEDSEKPEMKLPDKDDSPDFQLILKDVSEKVDVRPLNSNEDLDCLETTEEVENPLIHKPEDSEQSEMKLPDKDDSPDFQLILKDDREKVDVRPLNSNEDLDCLETTEEVENPLIHKPEDSEHLEMKLPDKDDSPDFQLILKDDSEKVDVRLLNSNEDLDCLETTEEVENPLIHKPEDSEQSEMKLPDKDDSPDFQLILKDDSEKVDVRPLNSNEDLDCLETTEEVENPLIHKPEDSEQLEMKLPDKDDSPDFQLILKDDSEKVDVRPLNSNEDLDCLETTEEVENPLIHKPEDSEQLEMKLPDKDDSPDFQLILKDDSDYEMADNKENVCSLESTKPSLPTEAHCERIINSLAPNIVDDNPTVGDASCLNTETETTSAMPDKVVHAVACEPEETDSKKEEMSGPDCETVTASQKDEMNMTTHSKLQLEDFNISEVNTVPEVSTKLMNQLNIDETTHLSKISDTENLKCLETEISTATVVSLAVGEKLGSTSLNLPDPDDKNSSSYETIQGELVGGNASLTNAEHSECEPPAKECNPTANQDFITCISSGENTAWNLEEGPSEESAMETNADDMHTSTGSIEENVSPSIDPSLLQNSSSEKAPEENDANRNEIMSQLHSTLEEISAEFGSAEFPSKISENNLNINESQVHDSLECAGNFNACVEAHGIEKDLSGDGVTRSLQDNSMEYDDNTDNVLNTESMTEISSSDNQNFPQHDKFQTEKSISITNVEKELTLGAKNNDILPSHTKVENEGLEVSQKEESEDKNNKSDALLLQTECNSDPVKSYTKIIKIVTRDGKVCYLKIPANGGSQKNVTNEVLLATRSQVEKELADNTKVVCKGCSKTLDKPAMHHECIDNFCRFCGCQLQSREEFELHMFEKHVTLGVRNCPFCDLTLESMQILETHLQEHSTLRMAFSVCAGCRVQFRTRKGRELHPCRADVSVCTKCNLMFKSSDLLLQHNNAQHKLPSTISSDVTPRYECDICDLLLPSEKKLQSHRQWHFDDCSSKLPQKQEPEENDVIVVLDEKSESPQNIDLEQEEESHRSKGEEIPREKCEDSCIQNNVDEQGNVMSSEQLCATGAAEVLDQNAVCNEASVANELQDSKPDTLQEMDIDQKEVQDTALDKSDLSTHENDSHESHTTQPDEAQDISVGHKGAQLPESETPHPNQQLDVLQKDCLATQIHQDTEQSETLDVQQSGVSHDEAPDDVMDQTKIATEELVENMDLEVRAETDLQNIQQNGITKESKIVESETQVGNQVLELPQDQIKEQKDEPPSQTGEAIQDIKCDLPQNQVETKLSSATMDLESDLPPNENVTVEETLSQSEMDALPVQNVVSSDLTEESSPEVVQVMEQKVECIIQYGSNDSTTDVDQILSIAQDKKVDGLQNGADHVESAAPQNQDKIQEDKVQNMEDDVLQSQTQEEKLHMFQDTSPDNSQDKLSDKNVQAAENCKHCSLTFESLASLYSHYNKVHFCNQCRSVLEGQSEFEQHMVEWHSTEKNCQFCCRTFRHGKDLKKHLQIHTRLEFKPITCMTCNTNFNRADFQKHNKCRNKAPSVLDLNISCDICKIFFQNEISRENHIIERHASTDSCPICDQTFFSSLELIEHVVAHQDVATTTFKCYACQFVSSSDKELDEHQCSVVSPEDSLEHELCPFCKKIIFTSESYESHLLEKHCNDNLCMLCDKDFESIDELKAHLNTHDSTEKEYKIENSSEESENKLLGETKANVVTPRVTEPALLTYCHICKVRFVIRGNFERHMMEDHSTEDECQFCKMKLASSSILAIHLASHTKLPYKPYKCNKCGESFSKESFLFMHSCLFPCKLCSEAFSNKYDLTAHKRSVHIFQCDLCPREFKSKAFLKVHLRVHTKVPQYCSKCKTKFNTVKELKDHDCIANKCDKKYKCPICKKIYLRANFYNIHLKTHARSLKTRATSNTETAPRTETTPLVKAKASPLSQKKLAAAKGKESPLSQKKLAAAKGKESPLSQKTLAAAKRKESPLSQIRQPVIKPKESPLPQKKQLVSKEKQRSLTEKKLLDSKVNASPLAQKKLPVCKEPESPLPQQNPQSTKIKGRVNAKDSENPKASTPQDSPTKTSPKLKVKLKMPISSWECKFCKLKFNSSLKRKKHETEEHIKKITCPICNQQFGTPEVTQKHIAQHNFVPTYNCEVCGTSFEDRPSLKNHKCSPRQCQFCQKTLLNYAQLKEHLLAHHVPHLPCTICNKTDDPSSLMKSPFLLSTHYVENHKVDFLPVKCAGCNIGFYSQKHLTAHTCPPELLEKVRAKQQAAPPVTRSYSVPAVDAQPSVTNDQFCIKEEPIDDWTLESSSVATDSPKPQFSLPTIKIEPYDGDYTPVFNPINEASYLCLHCKQFFETPQILNEHYCKVQYCKFCEKKFKKKLAFEVHMMTEHKMKNACQFCDRKFKKASGLTPHLKTHTNIQVSASKPAEPEKSVATEKPIPQPLHPCKICKKNFNSKQLWEAHMMDNHSSENECQFCDKTFQKNALLIRHLKSHTTLPYTYKVKKTSTETEATTVANDLESTTNKFCQICKKKFVVKASFDRHMISQHKSTSTCQFCGSVFHNLRVLLKHVKTHTSMEPQFECEQCKQILNGNEFGVHKCKPAEPPPIKKTVEPAPFKKPVAPVQSRKRSLSVSETESPIEPPKVMKKGPEIPTKVHQDSFKCLLCSKVFETDVARKNHLKLHHRVDAESLSQLKADVPSVSHAGAAPRNSLTCNHCDMSFENHSELRHHAKEAQVYCDFCRCTLPSSMEYESHMLELHSMGRTCQFCGAQFGNKAALSLHLRRHTSLKPIFFKCFHCGEKFHTELEKQNHPCKAWTCEVCDVRFPNEEALENHSCDEEQLLSDSECENCQSKFSSGQLLLQHMQVCRAPSASAPIISPNPSVSSSSKRKQDFKDKEVVKHQKLLDGSTTLSDNSGSTTLSDVSGSTTLSNVSGSAPKQPARRGRPLKRAKKKPVAPEVVECKYCKKSFLTAELYLAHCQEKHWYKCGVCGKKFEKEDDMEQHLIWHRVNAIAQQYNPSPQPPASKTVVIRPIASSTDASPRGRPAAASNTSGPRILKGSLRSGGQPIANPTTQQVQGNITAFLCNTCGIYLSSSQALATHKRSHMVFQCTLCSRVLSTAHELAEHTQTHATVTEEVSSDDDDIAVLLEVKSQNPSATKPLEYGQFVLLD